MLILKFQTMCCLFDFLREEQILRCWNAVHTFLFCLFLVRICLIFLPKPGSVLRVDDVNRTTGFPGWKGERSSLHHPWFGAQMPCVFPTLLFLGQLSCRNCEPDAQGSHVKLKLCAWRRSGRSSGWEFGYREGAIPERAILFFTSLLREK